MHMSAGPYTKDERLADVLALIQVLALDVHPKRTEIGMQQSLQGPPTSASSWFALAGEHREMFRVDPSSEFGLSLVARFVSRSKDGQGSQLEPEFVSALLQTAITMHDRQVQVKEWWKSLIPLWSALVGAIVASATTLFALWLNGWCKP
jgi:hypothetical protein